MDYKNRKNQDELIKFKDEILSKINTTLIDEINGDNQSYKRSAVICYWLKDYNYYLNFEKTFTPQKMKKYKRGDIIKVNFGFNVGSEHGGMHYAIILDCNNSRNSGVITVIPLISKDDEKEVFPTDVDLGNEIHSKMKIKFDTLNTSINNELKTATEMLDVIKTMESSLPSDFAIDEGLLNDENNKAIGDYIKETQKLNNKVKELQKANKIFKKMSKEIGRMKTGSIAVVDQITTISKMRIFDPKTSYDVLSGIRLGDKELDLIDEMVKKLFIKNK